MPYIFFAIWHFNFDVADSIAQEKTIRLDVFLDSQYTSSVNKVLSDQDRVEVLVYEELRKQQLEGYYLAELDSISWDLSSTSGALYIRRGPLVRVQRVKVYGAVHIDEDIIAELLDTKLGGILQPEVLEADVDRIIRYYEEKGYPFVKVSVSDILLLNKGLEDPGIDLSIQIEEGGRAWINDVLIVGAKRTRQSYIEYLMGFKQGDVLSKDLEVVRSKLAATEHFTQVSPIELIEVGDDEYVALVQLQEEVPGAFDLVLGYQPPVGDTNSGGVVGNGHLDLRNMFGMGRRVSLRLNRLPGQISTLDAFYADSYFWGSPLSVEGGFQGIQQDSTYNQQSYRGGIGYQLLDGISIYATINREAVRPGKSGVELIGGRQGIARSEITFWGFSIRYKRLDSPANPRRGIHLETGVEGGRKRRTEFELEAEGDTTMSTRRLQQQRLSLLVRGYLPFFDRQALVLGNDTKILVSEDFDTSDLFRLGGAQSLRGYDEDRFRGRMVSRVLLEWRYLFERTSYAYLFFDVGLVDRPRTAEFDQQSNIYPGYGLGMQFQTGIGLINTSLALSTLDSPSQAKVHVGLSLGL